MGRHVDRWAPYVGTDRGAAWWVLAAVLPCLLAGASGCAELLGIEPFEERYRDAGPPDAAGGTGGDGDGGAAGAHNGGSAGHGGAGGQPPITWSLHFGDLDDEEATDVVEDGAGNVIVAGTYQGTLDVNSHVLDGSGGGANVFLMKRDAQGQPLWSHGFLGTRDDQGRAVALTDQDEVILAGFFVGDLSLGNETFTATGTGKDVFVARYASDGAHLWSKSFPGANNEEAFDVAWDANSQTIVLAGRFGGALQMGDSLTSAGGFDAFVAKLDRDGVAQWAKQFGDAEAQAAVAMAVDAAGGIYLTGELHGTADFGDGDVDYVAGKDIFLARLDANGDGIWGHGFGSTADEEPVAIAVDSQRNVIICGYLFGMVNFGGVDLDAPNGADMFIAKFNSAGLHQWSKSFGGVGGDVCYSLAVHGDDSVLAAGRFADTVNFGGEDLTCQGTGAIFLVRFDAAGNHLESTCYGQEGTHIPSGLAATSAGGVLLAGSLGGTADFGHGPLTSLGGRDVFVAKLAL